MGVGRVAEPTLRRGKDENVAIGDTDRAEPCSSRVEVDAPRRQGENPRAGAALGRRRQYQPLTRQTDNRASNLHGPDIQIDGGLPIPIEQTRRSNA